jgi:NAD(P)-dependent dehydrogenase (short-subunit alcohol dehydrogenase family)
MVTDRFDIADRTAIVTGASGGIGQSIAETYAAEGANVVICSRSRENFDPVVEEIRSRTDVGAHGIECDVRDRDAVRAMVEETVERFGGVDILVNNAGGNFESDFENISENGWQTILDINLNGAFHCTQVVGEWMREHGGGNVINLSSVTAFHSAPRMAHYGAAKAGLVNLTRTVASEWAEFDIRVNGIAPGSIITPGSIRDGGKSPDEINRSTVDRQTGIAQEIADVALFLASESSSFITGETITVAGTGPPPGLYD